MKQHTQLHPSVAVQRRESILELTLNRPDVLNSFNREMALALQEHLDTADADPALRVVVLKGNGKAFCAGQDLAEVLGLPESALGRIVEEHYNPIILKIRNLSKPVVAAVNGVAAGAGANLALACDIVLAKESASFIQAFSNIGLIPDTGGTYFLPRLIGMQRASALMMLGEKINASDALSLGMVYKVFDDENFEQAVLEIAQKLAKMPTKGLFYTKKLLNETFNNTLAEQLELERVYQAQAGQTFDYKEGVQAFMEKRKPKFTGQ